MKKLSLIKRISVCLAGALVFCSAAALAACNNEEQETPVAKSGVAVCNAIEGIEKTEYVFCVSKKSVKAQTYLDAINAVIASTDVDALITKYLNRPAMSMDYYLGELTVEHRDGDPLNIHTWICSPYQFSGAFGSSIDGVDIYLLVKAANSLNMNPIFYNRGYQSSYDEVKNGTGDIFATAVAKTDKVEADFYISNVYSTGYQQIVSDKNEAFKSVSQLKGMKIAVIEGRPGKTIIEEAIENGELKDSSAQMVVFDTDAEAYAAYEAQGCDVIIADEYSAKAMLKTK